MLYSLVDIKIRAKLVICPLGEGGQCRTTRGGGASGQTGPSRRLCKLNDTGNFRGNQLLNGEGGFGKGRSTFGSRGESFMVGLEARCRGSRTGKAGGRCRGRGAMTMRFVRAARGSALHAAAWPKQNPVGLLNESGGVGGRAKAAKRTQDCNPPLPLHGVAHALESSTHTHT